MDKMTDKELIEALRYNVEQKLVLINSLISENTKLTAEVKELKSIQGRNEADERN